MRTGRPIPPLTLTPAERETLERWARRAKTAQAVAQRARLILGCAAGRTNTVVAQELRLTKQTVGKWRRRFLTRRLDGLLDDARPGAPRTITDAQVEHVLTRTLEIDARRRDALEHAVDGAGQWAESERGAPYLAGLRAAAPPDRDLQAVDRSRSSSRRCGISWACISSRRIARWCCAWTRRARSRRSIGPSRSCPCGRAKSSGGPTTTRAMAPPRCSPRSTRRRGRSLGSCIDAIAASSSGSSSIRSTPRCRRTWTCISSWTTTAPTRPP